MRPLRGGRAAPRAGRLPPITSFRVIVLGAGLAAHGRKPAQPNQRDTDDGQGDSARDRNSQFPAPEGAVEQHDKLLELVSPGH